MTSPNWSSCMKACSSSNGFSSQYSPRCTIIKRCTSPKPPPVPGCKWVKRCSPTVDGDDTQGETELDVDGITPIYRRRYYYYYPGYRRRYYYHGSPFMHHRRHHFGRISPFATTAIGHHRGGWGSPMMRGRIGSPMIGRRF